jgi:hypothetical protein
MSEDTSGIIVVGLVVTTVGVLAIDYAFSEPGESYVDRITKKIGGKKKDEEDADAEAEEKQDRERRERRRMPPEHRLSAKPAPPAPRPRAVVRPPVRRAAQQPPSGEQTFVPHRTVTPPPTPRTVAPPPPSPGGSDVVREVQALLNSFDLHQIQGKLKAHGFPSIPDDVHLPLYVDGILGKDTSRTLAVIQQQLGLPVTGSPDPQTVRTLREHSYQLHHPVAAAQSSRAHEDEGFGSRVFRGLQDMFSGDSLADHVGAEGDWKSETVSLGPEAQAVIQKIVDAGSPREKQSLSKLLKDAGFSAASDAMGAGAGASRTGFWEFPPWGGPWGSGDPWIDALEGPDFGPWGTWGFDGYSYSPWNYDEPNYMGWWTPFG